MIKKMILMLLVLVGGVVSANADNITIYFKPNSNWTQASARFALYMWNSTSNKWALFTDFQDGVYSATWDTSYNSGFKFVRLNPSGAGSGDDDGLNWDNKWDESNTISSLPTLDTYYIQNDNSWSNWNPSTVTTYLPWNYYFLSGSGDTWAVDNTAVTTNTNGVYTFSFSGETYANKRVTWVTGDAINANGTLISGFWNKVCKSKTQENNDDWITFANFSYNSVDKGTTGSAWYVPATDKDNYNDGQITITFNSSDKSATITSSKTVTIKAAESNGAYYATFSSKYAVAIPSGITAYWAGTTQTESGYVKMTSFTNGIPAGVGAFLKMTSVTDATNGDEYTFTPPASTDDVTVSGDLLKATTGENIFVAGKSRYVFAKQGNDVGFYKLGSAYAPALGKAYLDLTGVTSGNAPSLSIELDGETTGIKVVNLDENIENNGQMFDLQGRRVAEPTKGIYIVNGKKVIVK